MNKKSILRSILYINISFVIIHILIFVFVSQIYFRKVTDERNEYLNNVLGTFSQNCINEMKRLDQLTATYSSNSDFILAISDKLDKKFFTLYAKKVCEKLAIMRNSIPYAKAALIYSMNNDVIVEHSSLIINRESYFKVNPNAKDLLSLEIKSKSGMYSFNSDAWYINKFYDYGFIAIQIDMDRFIRINSGFGDEFSFIILDENNEPFYSNFPGDSVDIEMLLSNDYISVDNVKYFSVFEKIYADKFTCVVLTDNSVFYKPLNYFVTISSISFVLLLLSSILLIILNVKTYLPFRRFTTSFGGNNRENELSFIEEKISDLLYDIYNLSNQNTTPKAILPDKLILCYLLYGGKEISDIDKKAIHKRYSYFHLVVFSLQNEDGEVNSLDVIYLEKYIFNTCKGQLISIDKFTNAILLPETSSQNLKDIMLDFIRILPHKAQIFMGISENCANIMDLNTEYRLTFDKMMNSPVCNDNIERLSEQSDILHKTQVKNHGSMYAEIVEGINSGSFEEADAVVKTFLQEHGLSLHEFIRMYIRIAEILEKIASQRDESFTPLPRTALYNTEYMTNLLSHFMSSILFQPQVREDSLTNKVIEYIRLHLHDDLNLQSVADYFSKNPTYLSNTFKKDTGLKYTTFVSNERMKKAIEILNASEDIKIFELARAVGIDNINTFIRQFKTYMGTTPEQYKKNHLNIRR